MARKSTLGVAWSLPNANGKGFRKRPFMYSTVAVANTLRMLAEDGHTFKDVLELDGYLYDEKTICLAFVEAGYGDVRMRDWIS